MEPIITSWGVIMPEDVRPITTIEFIWFVLIMFSLLICFIWACQWFVESEIKRLKSELDISQTNFAHGENVTIDQE